MIACCLHRRVDRKPAIYALIVTGQGDLTLCKRATRIGRQIQTTQ